MSTSRLLAALLLSAPALARAASHTISVRATNGSRSYEHTSTAEPDAASNFAGTVDGQRMVVNAVLAQSGGVFSLQYQIEVAAPDGSRSFSAQSSLTLRSGDGIRAVECGAWKLDLGLDAAIPKGASPSSTASGSNLSLTTFAGKRTCKVVSGASVQSNVVDSVKTGGRKSGFIINASVGEVLKNTSTVQYQLENSGATAQGEATLTVGKKTRAKGGKVSFLVEGGAPPPR